MNLDNPIGKGNTAKIYLDNHKIIKVLNDFLPENEAMKEAKKQQYAYLCGLPVPKVLDITVISGRQAIIMEYVKGESLGDLFLKNKEQAKEYLKTSINIQLNIHNIIPDTIEPMYDKLYRQIDTITIIDERQKSYLLRYLESLTYENRLCHGDFHLFNLIETGNEVAIID